MAPLAHFRTEISGGERRLRFTTIMTNEGAGPLEVHGVARQPQRAAHAHRAGDLRRPTARSRLVDSRALMEYASDGHDHWHIQGVMLYQMWSDDGADSARHEGRLLLPRQPADVRIDAARVRHVDVCGDRSDTDNLMGLSVGWGDEYPADFAFQWIDISTLPPGDYTVQARADEQDWYVESDETNNCAWARIAYHRDRTGRSSPGRGT